MTEETTAGLETRLATKQEAFRGRITPQLVADIQLLSNMLNIKMNDLFPWYHVSNTTISNATSQSMYSDRVKEGYMRVLTHVSAKEATNVPTTIELGIERGGQTIILTRAAPGAVDISVDYDGQAMLIAGDRVKCTFYGGTSEDAIDISCSGYEIKA